MAALIHSHCQSAGLMAERIGLDSSVGEAVACAFERWDGGGLPQGRAASSSRWRRGWSSSPRPARCTSACHGTCGALAMARARSGKQFDPALVEALGRCRDRLNALPDQDVWARALELAPTST